jgi:hypothetical protein
MNDEQCSHEPGVRRAIEDGGLTDDLQRHVSQCASCREVMQVARFMKGVARTMDREAMPDARAMWSRIQLAERRKIAERTQRPARLAWLFAKWWFAGVVGLALYREWPVAGDFILAVPDYIWISIAVGAAIYIKGRNLLQRWGRRSAATPA